SVRALRNLERGRTGAAQRRSAQALADALDLVDDQRADFLAAARTARQRSTRPAAVAGTPPHGALCAPPALVPDFVGRAGELGRLLSWAREAGDARSGSAVCVVGHAGIGKTALAVAAVWQLSGEFADGCLAVDLRGMDDQPLPVGTALDRMLR